MGDVILKKGGKVNGIYTIKMNEVGYCRWFGWVVIAKTRAKAIKMCKEQYKDEAEWKGGFVITFLGKSTKKEGVVFDSYNDG
jgi:hypothetical protein